MRYVIPFIAIIAIFALRHIFMKKNELSSNQAKIIDEILDGGNAFYEIDKTIPYDEKKKYY